MVERIKLAGGYWDGSRGIGGEGWVGVLSGIRYRIYLFALK